MCVFLTACWSAGILKLVVHMERPIGRRPETHLQMLSDCLECLSEGRGPGRAIILTEPQHSATAAKVAKLLITDIVTFEDVSRITCAYEARVLRHLKEKRWNDARDTLQNALDFLNLPQYRLRASRLIGATDKRRYELEVKVITMLLAASRLGERATCIIKSAKCFGTAHRKTELRPNKKVTGIG